MTTEPLIKSTTKLAEFNIRIIGLALIITVILTAANAYIGLLVGMTVSASIPAAAISMAILRWYKNSNVLQNNMIQTSASAGEALAAGVIFTVPALVIMQAWPSYQYLPIVLIAISGGILGVIFTIPLRHALIVDKKLTYPEGVATAQLLTVGHNLDKHSSLGVRHLFQAAGISAIFKLLESGFGMISTSISKLILVPSLNLLTSFHMQFSPALLGIGYILNIKIVSLVFIGGLIGTLIGIPTNWLLNQEQHMLSLSLAELSVNQLTAENWQSLADTIWHDNRRIGIGAMLVGGIWSLLLIAKPIYVSIKTNFSSFKDFHQMSSDINRTEQDLPFKYLLILVPVILIPLIYSIYPLFSQSLYPAFYTGLWCFLLIFFAFIFASVAGYMAGIVGSSNNPISGVTIATVLISSLIIFYLIGESEWAKQLGPLIVMFLAAVTCSAAAIAGDNLQDLKCGHLLGATPWKQQAFQILGVVTAALVLPLILMLLDQSYGIGRPAENSNNGTFLAAPQANLMKELTQSIFNQSANWLLIQLGMLLGAVLILVDFVFVKLKVNYRIHVLAVAIGIYLPFGLTITMLFGALIKLWVEHKLKHKSPEFKTSCEHNGLLLASGFITGEALMGVLLAFIAGFVVSLPEPIEFAHYTGLLSFSIVGLYLYKRAKG